MLDMLYVIHWIDTTHSMSQKREPKATNNPQLFPLTSIIEPCSIATYASDICFSNKSERVPYVPTSHMFCLQETFYYFILAFLKKLKNGINININKIVCYMYIMYEGVHIELLQTNQKLLLQFRAQNHLKTIVNYIPECHCNVMIVVATVLTHIVTKY